MKTKSNIMIMRIVVFTFLLVISVPIIGQVHKESYFTAIESKSFTLSSDQSQKLNNILNNKIHKSVTNIKISDILQVVRDNNGALPIILPQSLRKFMARPIEIEYISDSEYFWKGTFINAKVK